MGGREDCEGTGHRLKRLARRRSHAEGNWCGLSHARDQERKTLTANCDTGKPKTGENLKKRGQSQQEPTIQRQQLVVGNPSRVEPA